MVLKATGYSQKYANSENYKKENHFKDVPEWFKGYVGLGVNLKLTNGKSKDSYDPDSNLSKREFNAFILRTLEYDNNNSYKDADKIAKEIRIINKNDDINSKITKEDAAKYIFSALNKKLNDGTGITLGEFLIKSNVISEEKSKEIGTISDNVKDNDVHISYFNDFHGNIAEEITGKKRNMGMLKWLDM